jgi:uncharacterized protein YbaA (DUF1428 family)
MSYVDVVLIPVANADKTAFIAHAETTHALFKKHGASYCFDAWGDDVPEGKLTDMRRAVALKDGETVCAGWIVWPDKATRDAAWSKMMDEMKDAPNPPFDGKRMIFGGFAAVAQG